MHACSYGFCFLKEYTYHVVRDGGLELLETVQVGPNLSLLLDLSLFLGTAEGIKDGPGWLLCGNRLDNGL